MGSRRIQASERGMEGYTYRDVSRMLDLSVGQVRSYARAGILEPSRGARGEYRFGFQDLVLLRAAKGLLAARIPPRRVRHALSMLKRRLPHGRPLSGVSIRAEGDEVLVRDGHNLWNPESGQTQFDFESSRAGKNVAVPAARIVSVENLDIDELGPDVEEAEENLGPDDWYILGTDLEAAAPDHAREAYRRALEVDPNHVDARINLGRLLHEASVYDAAESHFRLVLARHPSHATVLFNLGVTLEDTGRREESRETYKRAIQADPKCADAYYNLARLEEQFGNPKLALTYLQTSAA